VQRISKGRIEAKKAEVNALTTGASAEQATAVFQSVLDGIQTACQQACATQAITFGNMANVNSEVATLKREHRPAPQRQQAKELELP
jgi:Fe-S-cluster-containing dehydrogenase component